MATSLADQYYIKALDTYPYELEMALENLNYALSYDDEHAGANYLMGRVQMEQFGRYELAEEYFQEALSIDPNNKAVCENYAQLLIKCRKYEHAKRLIAYFLQLPGACLSRGYHLRAILHEYQHQYSDALHDINLALQETYHNSRIEFLENEEERVKNKIQRSGKVKYSCA